jgi:hypothetical protein
MASDTNILTAMARDHARMEELLQRYESGSAAERRRTGPDRRSPAVEPGQSRHEGQRPTGFSHHGDRRAALTHNWRRIS